MSDLQDVIVSSSIRAFNAGLATGIIQEQERIINLLENPYFHNIQSPEIHIDCEMCKTITLIKGDDNGKDG
jgi:hypothetical protein